jgi:REP element-mobilizing transposase RayT
MNNNSQHHRRSIRLKDYDYSSPGAYFITINTFDHQSLFGAIENGVIKLNAVGELIEWQWQRLPSIHSHIQLDAYIVMPDHLHGILVLKDTLSAKSNHLLEPENAGPKGTVSGSIGQVIQNFKSITTRRIRQLTDCHDLQVWQRNYYDRIIRNQAEWEKIHQYILTNPQRL